MLNYYWTVVFDNQELNIRILNRPILKIEEKLGEDQENWVPGKRHWEPMNLICEIGEGGNIINSSPTTLSLLLKSTLNHKAVEQWDLFDVVTTENEIDHDIIQVDFKSVKYESLPN